MIGFYVLLSTIQVSCRKTFVSENQGCMKCAFFLVLEIPTADVDIYNNKSTFIGIHLHHVIRFMTQYSIIRFKLL